YSLRSTKCVKGIYGSKPDESLFHELVHGLRDMEGHDNSEPALDDLKGYDNREDFLVIVVTNIYISAKTNAQDNQLLRANHRGHDPLPKSLSTGEGFLRGAGNLGMLVSYYNQEFYLFQSLALVDCVFNPIRQLVFNGPRYYRPDIYPIR